MIGDGPQRIIKIGRKMLKHRLSELLDVGREVGLLNNIYEWLTLVLSVVKRPVGIGKTSARMDFFQGLIGSAICGGYQYDTRKQQREKAMGRQTIFHGFAQWWSSATGSGMCDYVLAFGANHRNISITKALVAKYLDNLQAPVGA